MRALHNFHNVSGGNGVLKREARKSFRFTVMKKHSVNFDKVKGFNKDEPWKSVYVTVVIILSIHTQHKYQSYLQVMITITEK